jgi:hypothetical protein
MLKIKLESPLIQYAIGVLLNIALIITLYSSNISFNNLQIPEGLYKNNVWKGMDVISYVNPARNFLQYGVFGFEQIPDCQRTIGYPFFLVMMMKIFSTNWLLYTFILQALIFALIYPTITNIIKIVIGNDKFVIIGTFLFLVFSGTYLVYTTVILTDTLMTVLLTIGIFFGLKAVINKSYIYLIINIVAVGLAAQIRPILFLFGFINLFILYSFAKIRKIENVKGVKWIIITSSFCLLILCNLPTLRNYINYKLLRPTVVFDDNLLKSLGTKVLIEKNEIAESINVNSSTDSINNLNKKLEAKRDYAYDIFYNYPLMTFIITIRYAGKMLLKNHIVNLTKFWNYDWKEKESTTHMPLKKSKIVYIITLLLGIVYFVILLLNIKFIFKLIKNKKYFYTFTIVLFILYFLVPSSIFSEDIRFRLPFESLLIIVAFYEIHNLVIYFINKKILKLKN